MPSAINVAGEVAGAAAALAGLILVFLGSVATAFDSFQKQEQNAVRARYQRRAWFTFVGFVLSLLVVALALVGKWLGSPCAALAAMVLLGIALGWVFVAALGIVREIK